MKRLTRYLKDRILRIAKYRYRSRQKRRRRHWISVEKRFVAPRELIVAPRKFNLIRGDAFQVVHFLRAVATRVLVDKKPVKLDFQNTESLYVAGAILLYAELDRISRLSTLAKPLTIINPRAKRPREVLKQIGLYVITNDSCDVVPEREDVVFWKATKGNDQSGNSLGPILEFVAERVNKDHVAQVEISGIWRGVSEAVINTVDHAYKHPRSAHFEQLSDTKWWMFTQVRDGIFSAAVCDLGCGYRATINQTIPEAFIANCKSLFSDASVDAFSIQTAMEYGRSGTRESNRGKGSRDALSVLGGHGVGELHIVSNTGWVKYTYKDNVQKSVSVDDVGIDIKGTIIWWNLPMKEQEHA